MCLRGYEIMADTQTQQASGGMGCLTVLGLIFVTLKLTGNIDWSWWWVLAPWWAPISLVLAGLIIYLVIALIIEMRKP